MRTAYPECRSLIPRRIKPDGGWLAEFRDRLASDRLHLQQPLTVLGGVDRAVGHITMGQYRNSHNSRQPSHRQAVSYCC